MQPPHPRPSARRWLRHLGSAATAVALIAAVLTPIALGAGPADAHTQRVQRCSFDPFAGQQCWYEDVAHTHTPPPTSTPPGQGHPGGTDNEQDDLPDPPDTTPPGQGHPGGTDNEQDDLPDPPDTTPPGEGHPGGTDNEQQDLPTRPGDGQSSDPNNQENGDDQAADTECLSGTFISGNCQPRQSDDEEGEGDDDSGRPSRCDTHPPQAGCLQQDDGDDEEGGTTDPIAAAWGWLREALEVSGEAQIAQSEAYEALGELQKEQVKELADAIHRALEASGEARIAEAEAWQVQGDLIRDLWYATPQPARIVAITTFCAAAGVPVSAVTTPAGGFWFAVLCGSALGFGDHYLEPPVENGDDSDDSDDADDNGDADTPTGNYCSAWSGFGFFKTNGEEVGEVVLHENGGSGTSYQGAQEWATATCQAALAAQGQ
ncbi:hypothetical protein [Candidatus Poriferisodalis sp.]|uniref:hypothetical protein n=1 Tax=Candidatus Poriferisodalis sp. TaxID=3101277 RepID=UPI003B01F93E